MQRVKAILIYFYETRLQMDANASPHLDGCVSRELFANRLTSNVTPSSMCTQDALWHIMACGSLVFWYHSELNK